MSGTESSEPSNLPSAKPEDPPAPLQTRASLWFELMAVLAIGVLPQVASALSVFVVPYRRMPMWLEAVHVSLHSLFVIMPVLYIMHRSGKSWAAFGIVRPRVMDMPFALLMLIAGWVASSSGIGFEFDKWARSAEDDFAIPRSRTDYLLMMIMYFWIATSEELVCRAYLIPRLQELTGSVVKAIVLSSILFTSYHIYYGIGGVAGPFLFGMVYSVSFVILQRIWPLAVGHALVDILISWRPTH